MPAAKWKTHSIAAQAAPVRVVNPPLAGRKTLIIQVAMPGLGKVHVNSSTAEPPPAGFNLYPGDPPLTLPLDDDQEVWIWSNSPGNIVNLIEIK